MSIQEIKQQQLENLYASFTQCVNCPLGRIDEHFFVFGSGNANADFMIIGEAPGQQEEEQGLPFVGRSGQLLTKILNALDIKRKDIFITNVVKCRPQGNRTPTIQEREAYKDILLKQIEIIQPKSICTLGTVAAHTLLNTQAPITKLRGTVNLFKTIPLIPTYHPAYILRNMSLATVFAKDIQRAFDLIENTPKRAQRG